MTARQLADTLQPPKTRVRQDRGGRRRGSGRKPTAAVQLIKAIEAQTSIVMKSIRADASEEADYAFSLYCHFMRDESLHAVVRASMADRVLDRILGKPMVQARLIGQADDGQPRAFSYTAVAALLLGAAVEQGTVSTNDAISAIGKFGSAASVAGSAAGPARDPEPSGA